MKNIQTSRLRLSPFAHDDFNKFVVDMLTDPRVVKFYHSYREMDDVDLIRVKAQKDFWEHFEESRTDHNLEVWAAHTADETNQFIGWCG